MRHLELEGTLFSWYCLSLKQLQNGDQLKGSQNGERELNLVMLSRGNLLSRWTTCDKTTISGCSSTKCMQIPRWMQIFFLLLFLLKVFLFFTEAVELGLLVSVDT